MQTNITVVKNFVMRVFVRRMAFCKKMIPYKNIFKEIMSRFLRLMRKCICAKNRVGRSRGLKVEGRGCKRWAHYI